MAATRRAARLARGVAASEPESLANVEQGAGCAKAGVPPLRIGSFCFFLHVTPPPLFHTIVRRFFRDDNVMHVALAQSRGGDSNESALFAEFLQCGSSHVAHPALESADELVGQRAKRAFVRHTALNAFRNGFAVL